MNPQLNTIHLYQTIDVLNSKEWQGFLHFARSPLFNNNKKVLALIGFLEKQYPNFDFTEVDSWQSIFPKKTFDQQKLKDVRSQLFRLLKKFLALQELEKDEAQWDLAVLQQLRNRQLKQLYKNQENLLKKKQLKNKNKDSWMSYQFLKERTHFDQTEELRNTEGNFQEVANKLDAFYVLEKLKWTCEMLNRSRIINKQYDLHLMEVVLDHLSLEHLQMPLIILYHQVYKTLTEPNEERHFQQLKNTLEREVKNLAKESAVSLYRYAQNYCIGKINKGEGHYMRELFDIYQQLLINDLLIENKQLAHPHYKNIVTLGLRLKEYDWTLNFIEDYKNQIEPKVRENAYHFNLATWYYEQENYDQVINLLNGVTFTDVYYEISSKYILIKVYYDSNEINPLTYLITSFDRYIRRNKSISSQNRQGILNFLLMLKKLVKLKEWQLYKKATFMQEQKEKLTCLLEDKKPMVNLVWLKQKLGEY